MSTNKILLNLCVVAPGQQSYTTAAFHLTILVKRSRIGCSGADGVGGWAPLNQRVRGRAHPSEGKGSIGVTLIWGLAVPCWCLPRLGFAIRYVRCPPLVESWGYGHIVPYPTLISQ
jgi:hypothetical protein